MVFFNKMTVAGGSARISYFHAFVVYFVLFHFFSFPFCMRDVILIFSFAWLIFTYLAFKGTG